MTGEKIVESAVENKPKFAHISLVVTDGCKNLDDSFGDICVKCNECERFDGQEVRIRNDTFKI